MIRADKMLSNVQKAELKHQKKEKKNEITKKKTSKTKSMNLMNIMIDNLIKKMKALILQILIMSEAVTNQMRVSLLQRFCDASASAFSDISRLEYFDCDKSDYNIIYCFLINIMCKKRSEEHTSELQSHSDLVCRL